MRCISALLTALAASVSVPSGAAIIINAVANPGATLISAPVSAGADLTNNGPYSTATSVGYILDEGKFGGKQTFLLHYDKNATGASSGTTSGSFDIQLGAGESFGGFITTLSGLLASDPPNGVIYQTAPGSATTSRGLEGDDLVTTTLAGSTVSVTYKFVNGTPFSLDDTRFTVLGAVPEPATWGMMIAGFGAVGGAMRSRRRRTALAGA